MTIEEETTTTLTVDSGRIAELDGLRALAVLPVIAYHFGATVNGAAGVTVFFALSGFIVSTLLIAEHERRGVIDLRAFYVRRLRRLAPAATCTVIATVIVGRLLGQPPILRQAIASLTYWANFERFTSRYAYGQIAYAPLEHFWSLAIEEQFYLLLPMLCIVLVPRGRRWLGSFAMVGLFASAAFAFVHRHEPQMYFHSAARVCELLIGVALAVFGRRLPALAGYLGLAGLVAVFVGAVTPPPIVIAGLACVVIAARPRILAIRPLVLIGTYSYGLYLWHPISAVISDQLWVRIAITIAATVVSYHVVEYPVRHTLPTRRAVYSIGSLSVAAFVLIGLTSAVSITYTPTAPVIAAAPSYASIMARSTPGGASTASLDGASEVVDQHIGTPPLPPLPPARPLRISGAGDSTQMFLDAAWQAWAAQYPADVIWVKPPAEIVPWTSGADGWITEWAATLGLSLPFNGPQGGLDRQGCPLMYDIKLRAVSTMGFADSRIMHSALPIASCDWHLWMPAALAQMHLDVLIVSWGVTAMWDYQMPDGHTAHVGDADFDALLTRRMTDFESMAARFGTRVMWTTYQPKPADDHPARWGTPDSANAFANVALRRPCVSDLRTAIRQQPDFAWYQDGYHLTAAGAASAVAAMTTDLSRCGARAVTSPQSTPVKPL